MNRHLKNFLILAILIPVPAFCEATKLSLENAVDAALKNNLKLKQNQISLETKIRENKASWNSASPTIKGSGSWTKDTGNQEDGKFSASLGVRVALSANLYTSIKGAMLALEQQKITYSEAERSIELSVRKEYFNLLYQKENIILNRQSLETARRQYESNLAKYNRGTLSQVDVLSAEITCNDSALKLQELETNLENSTATFKQILGIPQDEEIELTDSFDKVLDCGPVSIEGIQFSSPETELLKKKIESAQNSLLASRFSAYSPSVEASYSHSLVSRNEYDGNGSITVSASIPLDGYLPWSSSALKNEQAKDNLRTLELQLEDAKTSLEINAAKLLKNIEKNRATILQRKSSIDLAQRTYSMTLEAYNHGTKNLLALQTATDSLLSAKVQLIYEGYSLMSNILELENLLGIEFGTLANKTDGEK